MARRDSGKPDKLMILRRKGFTKKKVFKDKLLRVVFDEKVMKNTPETPKKKAVKKIKETATKIVSKNRTAAKNRGFF